MNIYARSRLGRGCSLKLLLIFILISLIELSILVYVGTLIGAIYTVGIVVVTGIIGGVVARYQGLVIISQINESINRGVIPSSDLFSGVLILLGCLLLITPGLIADFLGFLLLIPPTRHIIGTWMLGFIMRRIVKAQINSWT